MVAVESVGYVILYVRDLDVSVAFYQDVVGLPFKLRDAGYAEFVTGETKFGLLERARASDLIHREPTEGGPAGEVLVRAAASERPSLPLGRLENCPGATPRRVRRSRPRGLHRPPVRRAHALELLALPRAHSYAGEPTRPQRQEEEVPPRGRCRPQP
jgi:catechol 2,3-dioxygenase-like lactoylglutathione lyase family enzyme